MNERQPLPRAKTTSEYRDLWEQYARLLERCQLLWGRNQELGETLEAVVLVLDDMDPNTCAAGDLMTRADILDADRQIEARDRMVAAARAVLAKSQGDKP